MPSRLPWEERGRSDDEGHRELAGVPEEVMFASPLRASLWPDAFRLTANDSLELVSCGDWCRW
jgi:hypothetical protein